MYSSPQSLLARVAGSCTANLWLNMMMDARCALGVLGGQVKPFTCRMPITSVVSRRPEISPAVQCQFESTISYISTALHHPRQSTNAVCVACRIGTVNMALPCQYSMPFSRVLSFHRAYLMRELNEMVHENKKNIEIEREIC